MPEELTLLERTKQLLAADDRSAYRIAADTELNYYWVLNMRKNRIKEPGIQKVEILHAYLTKTPVHA
jgi:hypothetical protein